MDVEPKVLHRWRVKGTLIQEIKASYEALPPASRGGYYPWFLQNEWVLNIALPIPNTLGDQVLEAHRRAWVLAGGSASDTDSQIDAKMSVLPKTTQQCHFLYTCLFLDQHPSPSQSDVMWISFGFCACHPPVEEMRLAGHYRELINSCTFDEFVTAFETSTLLTLMRSKGIHLYPFKDMKSLTEVMSGLSRECSVWFLKEFVMTDFPEEADADESPLALSFRVDYGFVNCQNEEEVSDLKSLYKQILEMRNVHAVDLHRFAIQGKLFEYVGGLVQLKKQKKFKRLLKNPYPLPVV
ncbi:hypothetical protein Hypma_012920 [Hypsizygus marmoreus]|uniref:Uncharacterized protein n=1 Tax=Hypsizygus marmoreus TaxID=39966 RepID=A0A369JFJ2_HYPMA|nr:hypothetical protein Hypma_012920 [Hypsizygus marmoreus]